MSSSILIQQQADALKVGTGDEDLQTPTKPLDSTGQNTNQSASTAEALQENKLADDQDNNLDELDTPKEQINNSNPKKEQEKEETKPKNPLPENNNSPAFTKNNTSNEIQQPQPSLSFSSAQLASSTSFVGSMSFAAASPQAKTKKNTTASPEVVQAVEEHTMRSNTRAISASPTPRDGSASPICKSLITLHYATDADMAEYMLSKGADIEALDKGGIFFVGVADQPNKKYEAANARPASPTRKRATSPSATLNRTFGNPSGNYSEDEKFVHQRPLHAAAQAGRWDVAYVLLLNGAQVNAMTTGDIEVTPLDYAIENLHFDVFDLLKAQGGQRTVASFSRMLARGLDEIALKKLEREYRRQKALEEGKELLSDDDDKEEEVVEFKLLDDVHAASPPTKSLQDNDGDMEGKRAGSAPATMKGKEKNIFVIDFSKEFRPDMEGARRNVLKRKSQQREKSADDARRNNKREESTKQSRDSKKNSPENNAVNDEGKSKQEEKPDQVAVQGSEDKNKNENSPKTSQQPIKNKEIENDDDERRDARLVEIIEKQLREQEEQDALEASLRNNNEQHQHQQPPSNSSVHLNQTKTDSIDAKAVDPHSRQQESKKQHSQEETLLSPNPQDPNMDKHKNNAARKETPQKRENQVKNTKNTTAQFENSFKDGFLEAALGKKGGPRILPAHHETPQVMKRKQQQEERRKKEEGETEVQGKETDAKQQKPSKRASSSNIDTKNNGKSRFDSPTASSNLKRTNSNLSNSTTNTNNNNNNNNNNSNKRAATPTNRPPQRQQQQQNRTSSTNSNHSKRYDAMLKIPHFTAWPDSIKVSKGTSSWARSTTPRMPIQVEVARGLYLPMTQVPDRAGGRQSLTEHELERERQEQIKRHKEVLAENEKVRNSSGDGNNDEIQQQQQHQDKQKQKSTSNFVPLTPHLRRDADIVEYILDKPLTPDEVAKQRALNDRLATPRRRGAASSTKAKKSYTIDDDNEENNGNDDDDYEESEIHANPPWNGRQQVDDSPASSRLSGRRMSPKQKRESYEAEKAVYMEQAKKVKEEREKEKMERVLRIKNFEQEMRLKKQQQQQHQQQNQPDQKEKEHQVEDDEVNHQEERRNETAENEKKNEVIHPPWNARSKMDPSPSLFSSDHIRQIREQQQQRTNSQTRSSQQRNAENSKKPSSLFLPSATNSEQPQRKETESETVKPNKNNEDIDEPLPRQEQDNNQTNKQHSESNVKKNTLRGRDVVAITFGNKNVKDNSKRDTPTRRTVNDKSNTNQRTTNNSTTRNSTPTRQPLTTSASLKNDDINNNNNNNNKDNESTAKQRHGSPIYRRQNTNHNSDNNEHNKFSDQNHQHRPIIHVSPSGRVSDPSISTTLAMHPNAAPRAMDQISFLAFGNAPFSAMPVQRNHSNMTHSPSKQRTSTPTRGGVQTSVKDEEVLGKPRWHN